MIHLNHTADVNSDFVAIVEQALNNALDRVRPLEVYVIQVDGWFDYKWQGFSGTVMHEIAIWRHRLSLPPFHTSRVLNQTHFVQADDSSYMASDAKRLHISQTSSANLNRRVADVSSSGVFLWYSRTDCDRGSLMMYTVDRGESSGWYVGLRRNGAWRLTRIKGASRREIKEIFLAKTGTQQIVTRERRERVW
jgi:hypothetical protein